MAAKGISRWAGKTALITGVSLGVGKATAKMLLENGIKVIGCGRSMENLEAAKDDLASVGNLVVIQCDISKEDEVNAMFEEIDSIKHGGVDIVINNAGLGKSAPIISGSLEEWRIMFDVNVLGLLMVTKKGIQSMKKKSSQECHVININSTGGHQIIALPDLHVYSATKFAVTAITEGLRNELLNDPLNCRVSQVCPGMINTQFLASQFGEEQASTMLASEKVLSVEDVAEAVIFQLSLPAHVQVQDLLLKHINGIDC